MRSSGAWRRTGALASKHCYRFPVKAKRRRGADRWISLPIMSLVAGWTVLTVYCVHTHSLYLSLPDLGGVVAALMFNRSITIHHNHHSSSASAALQQNDFMSFH